MTIYQTVSIALTACVLTSAPVMGLGFIPKQPSSTDPDTFQKLAPFVGSWSRLPSKSGFQEGKTVTVKKKAESTYVIDLEGNVKAHVLHATPSRIDNFMLLWIAFEDAEGNISDSPVGYPYAVRTDGRTLTAIALGKGEGEDATCLAKKGLSVRSDGFLRPCQVDASAIDILHVLEEECLEELKGESRDDYGTSVFIKK